MSSVVGYGQIAAADHVVDSAVLVIVVIPFRRSAHPKTEKGVIGMRLVGKRQVIQKQLRLWETQGRHHDVAKALGRNGSGIRQCDRCALAVAFVRDKEEEFVTQDGSSKRAAELAPHRVGLVAEEG